MNARRWTLRDLVRFWWLERRAATLGCGLTLAMAAVIMIAVALVLWPAGKSEIVEGRVQAFGFRETDFGSELVAYVTYRGRQDRIPVSPTDGCRAGDRIRLHTTRHLWGGYTAGALRDGEPICRRGRASFSPAGKKDGPA